MNIEKLYLNIILGSLSFMFFLWMIVNYLKVADFTISLVIFILSYYVWHILLRDTNVKGTKGIAHHVILWLLLLTTIVLWLAPLFVNPLLPLGRDYIKTIHDGLTIYFSRGNLPMFGAKMFLDYANEMHLLAAFFSFLRFPLFHLNLSAIVFAIIINSLAVYLIILELYGNKWHSALFAGVSGIISYRLPFLYYLSPPMLFSLLLILPSLYIFYLAQNEKKFRFYAAFGIAIGALTACYNGTSIVFYPLLLVCLAVEKVVLKKKISCKPLLIIALISIIFFFLAIARQGDVYYQNLLENMGDCNDASHYTLPFIDPIFLIFFLPSLVLFIINRKQMTKLGVYIIAIALILMLALPYYWMFNAYKGKLNSYEDCINAPSSGIFSSFNHQKVHRYAFMQPFIFILILPAFCLFFKNEKSRIAGVIILLLILLFGIIQIPLYWTGGLKGTVNLSELKDAAKISNLRFTAPFVLVKAPYLLVERGWSHEFRKQIFDLSPNVNETNKLVYVAYNDDNYISASKRYMLYLFFNRNYKYILNPKKFFEGEVYKYAWIITEPCSNDVPLDYTNTYKSERLCIFKLNYSQNKQFK